jgi:hypothetical protein
MPAAAVQTLDLVTRFEARRHGRHPGAQLGQRRSRGGSEGGLSEALG